MVSTASKLTGNGLRVIAVAKLLKGILMLGVAFGLFHIINQDVAELARKLAMHLRIDPENSYVRHLLEKLTAVSPRTLRNLGFLSLYFSVELTVEAVGLWYKQVWAVYLVLVATGIFLPREVYSCFLAFSWEKLVLFCVNLTFVAYLAWFVVPHRPAPPAAAAQ